MNTEEKKFDLWCMVELFGHQKIAGKCTEQNIAGTNMLRIDVPETEKQPAFTRFFGSAAIYAINPIDEVTARYFADKLEIAPIQSYNISEVLKKHNALALTKTTNEEEFTYHKSREVDRSRDEYEEEDNISDDDE